MSKITVDAIQRPSSRAPVRLRNSGTRLGICSGTSFQRLTIHLILEWSRRLTEKKLSAD
jgi:hypothetical protein